MSRRKLLEALERSLSVVLTSIVTDWGLPVSHRHENCPRCGELVTLAVMIVVARAADGKVERRKVVVPIEFGEFANIIPTVTDLHWCADHADLPGEMGFSPDNRFQPALMACLDGMLARPETEASAFRRKSESVAVFATVLKSYQVGSDGAVEFENR